MVVSSYTGVSTLEAAVSTPSVNLCAIKREYGEDAVIVQLVRHIVKLDAFLALKNGIGIDNAIELSRMILEDYPYITFADFACVCNRAKRGYYGKYYERLAPSEIYQWVADYFEQRCEHFEQQSTSVRRHDPSSRRSSENGGSLSVAMLKASVLRKQDNNQ